MKTEKAEQYSLSNNAISSNSRGMFNKTSCPKKSLVLFVDINYTIIVTSTRKGTNKKTGILTYLAEHYSAIWDATISNKEMTFKDFVKNHLCPDNEQDQIEQYGNFLEYLNDQHHELLNVISSEYDEIDEKLGQNEERDDIFPSFINLIHNLEANKHKTPYTLVLRTFGRDLSKTVSELERRTSLKFTSHAHFDIDGFLNIGNEIKKSPAEIRGVIKPFEHGAWQDNYARWKHNQFLAGGKLFPLDFHDEHSVSIFWDDNIGEKDKKILTVQLTSGEVITGEDQFEQMLIQSNRLVPVNAREAIKDNDYFIKLKDSALLQASLKNSSKLQELICDPNYEPLSL